MVHKIPPPMFGKTYRNIDVLKEKLRTELELDSKFIEEKLTKQFHKLPMSLQFLLTQPTIEKKSLKKIIPLPRIEPKGEEEIKKLGRRYGVFTIHDKKLYVGYVKPIGEERAEVRLREVFP